jgi:hypothetical protein
MTRETMDSIFDNIYYRRRVRAMQKERERGLNEDILLLELGTEMDIKNPLV